MDNFRAVNVAEGFDEPLDHAEYIAAWQHLVDTGLAWKLQGFFGRTATTMIQSGKLTYNPPNKHNPRFLDDIPEARW